MTTSRSLLGTLSFTDPHTQAGWKHAAVPATAGRVLPSAPDRAALDVEVVGAGTSRHLAAWLDETWATSLVVVAGGAVVHEWYADGVGPETLLLGASMTKSVLAHLVGMAVRATDLGLDDAVADHVPELADSGYAGVTVRDLLTMTTGVDWVEDHRDPASLASRLLASFFDGGESRALLGEVGAGVDPGTRFAYCTADSQVLDWVRERATGRPYAEAAADLWRALGCTSDAVVAVDGAGVALAGGGLAATARDWAKVAALAVSGNADDGTPLLDVDWVQAASRPSYPWCGVGRLPSTITSLAGFGHHWWPMDDAGRRVTADGSRGQLACADRVSGAVVVKTSQWPYEDFVVDRQARDLSYLGLHALLDAVASPHDPDPPQPEENP